VNEREPVLPEETGESGEPGSSGEPQLGEQVDFPCPDCGAETTWDPELDALACQYCGHRREVPRSTEEVIERPLEAAGEAARGLGLELRAVRCDECGATVSLERVATASSCVFCGSSNVLARESNRNALRPESLLPLDVGREAVMAGVNRWIRRLWFRPSALKKVVSFEAVGVYVPYWTFDTNAHSDWSADAGHYYWVTETRMVMVNGKLRPRVRQVRHTRWVPAWGQRDDTYDDLLINASRGVPDALAAKLGGFDTSALVPYRPEYLAGWRAEEYQVDLEEGWRVARERVIETQKARCAGDVPGDTYRDLRVSNALDDVRWKHVLLPMWTLSYEFKGKPYSVLVHGQTGKVVGKAPWSWVKIALAILAVPALALLAVLILAVLGG
jgi:DNA-directed RNA polymerase subunit RPC12/RpoP